MATLRNIPLALFTLFLIVTSSKAGEMRAGTAKAVITPDKPRVLVTGRMSRGKDHDIYARCLTLNDGNKRMAIVTYDLNCLDVATPILRKRCRDELGIDPACLILLATHNHEAPIQIVPDNFDYGRWLATRIFDLIKEAIAKESGPARLFFGAGQAYFVWSVGNAPVDFDVQVLKITVGDQVAALLFNHPTHPMQASSDRIGVGHPGYAVDEVEAKIPGALAMYADACGGNQFAIGFSGPMEKVQSLGRELADVALKISQGPMQDVTGPLASKLEVISLPLAPPIPYEKAAELANKAPRDIGFVPYPDPRRGTNWIRALMKHYNEKIPFPTKTTDWVCTDDAFLVKDYDTPREFPCRYEEVIVSRIGPMLFVAMQGEVCAPIGMRIKDAFRRRMPMMVFAYMGEHNLYIPTRELVRLDLYQAQVIRTQYASPVGWAPEVEDEMVNGVVRLARSMAGGAAAGVESTAAADPAISVDRIRADVKYLASDRLEGRGVGVRGEELTTDYIAKEFEKAGVAPAGERGTFFQRVPLVGIMTGPNATLAATKGDRRVDFKWGDDFVGQSHTQQPREDFDAEAVFVGHGITAPEFGWNDYQGIDVAGKVVVLFTNEPPSNDPKFFGGKALTYYGRWTFKFEEAARRGAKAVLIIHTNDTAGYPYSVPRRSESVEGAQMESRQAGIPALAFAGWLSQQAGDKLLAFAGKSVEMALKEADTRGFKPSSLGFRIKGHIPTRVRKIVSKNVAGIVEGSDPVLKSEAVIFTAHWDHLGVGKEAVSDNIYNGAADNGTGCAILMELARQWAAHKPRPKRSALFLATTAEEMGLLGAHHYAKSPLIPLGKTAVNLNFDMILPLGVPESLVVSGAERTTVWPTVQEAAKKLKLEIEPDKLAHLGMYYRSDHFALARAGVPAFKISQGQKLRGKPADYFQKHFDDFTAKVYHSPADEFREDWDFSGFPVLIRFALAVGREAANAPSLPTWAVGDEFRAARERSGVK